MNKSQKTLSFSMLFGIFSIALLSANTAFAWSCAPTHYKCAGGTSVDQSETSLQWTWACQDYSSGPKDYCVETKPKEVIVEKIVYVDKVVEVPVEKIVYQDKIVEKEVSVEKVVTVQVPVEKIVTVQVPVEKTVEKIVYKKEKHNDHDHKKEKTVKEAKKLPTTGFPVAGVVGVLATTAGLFFGGKRLF